MPVWTPSKQLVAPELLIPGRKPSVGYEVDCSHPAIAKNPSKIREYLYLFNDGRYPPVDALQGDVLVEDTTNGSTRYEYEPLNKNICFSRQDLDSEGICYHPSSTMDLTSAATESMWLLLVYTVLYAPAASYACFQVGNAPRDSNPVFLFNTENSSNLRAFFDGAYRYTSIPVNIGERHVLAWRYTGDTNHYIRDSAKGDWETFSNSLAALTTADNIWFGTGYNADLPVAFEFCHFCYGWEPGERLADSLIEDPYQILKPGGPKLIGIPTVAPTGAIMNSFQGPNVGSDLFNGTLQ